MGIAHRTSADELNPHLPPYCKDSLVFVFHLLPIQLVTITDYRIANQRPHMSACPYVRHTDAAAFP